MLQLVIGLLVLSALAAVLALLLELADSYLADYGEVTVDINAGQKSLTVEGGSSLLSTLIDQGIFIPSACGGKGSCGYCKVKVQEGAGPVLPTETPYLEPAELEANVRLSCQVKVRNDMAIVIPEELFLIREYRARTAAIRDLTPIIKELRLELLEPEAITFKPGQYIQLKIPVYDRCPEPIYRAYSICSAARASGGITLVITRAPEGLATTYVHDHLKVGEEVTLNGPYGEFYLRDSDRRMVMVATGSGIAPIMSILHQIADENLDRQAAFFFGVRSKQDLFYADEVAELQQRIPGLEFYPVLSDPAPEDQWTGETGWVTDVMARVIPDLGECDAYLCGNPFMIEAAVKLLTAGGMPEDRIYYDKFA